jgi:hypothetical protein
MGFPKKPRGGANASNASNNAPNVAVNPTIVYPKDAAMAYELFNPKATRLGSPALTIKTDGRITLNAPAGDLFKRAGARFVQILWDAGAFRLALRPLSKSGQSSYKLTVNSSKRGAAISGWSFLRYIGWSFSKSVTFPADWNEKEKVLEVSLSRDNLTGSQSEK